ncbi:Glutamate racemase 2 [compost metagenome]
MTLSQSKYTELVARVDDQGSVDSLPLPELVQYCEQLIWDREVIVDYFTTKLASFDLDQYGTVVLGCTHYPYYRKLLEEILPRHIHIIDGSEGTVKRLQSVLQENHLLGASTHSEIRYMCSSGDEQYVEKMQQALSFLRSRRGIPAGN